MPSRFEIVTAHVDATDVLEAVLRCVMQFREVGRLEPPGLLALEADALALVVDLERASVDEYRQRQYWRKQEWSRAVYWPESKYWRERRRRPRPAPATAPTVPKHVKASRSRRARASSI